MKHHSTETATEHSKKLEIKWVEFHEGNKIWEANNSMCKQINQ